MTKIEFEKYIVEHINNIIDNHYMLLIAELQDLKITELLERIEDLEFLKEYPFRKGNIELNYLDLKDDYLIDNGRVEIKSEIPN